MNGSMSYMVAAEKTMDPLDELRQHLLRISTSLEIDDTDAELVIQSLDAVTLLNQFPEYFCLKDRRGRVVFANAAALAAANIGDMQDVIGKTVLDLLPVDVAEPQFHLEQHLMSRGLFGDEREEFITGETDAQAGC